MYMYNVHAQSLCALYTDECMYIAYVLYTNSLYHCDTTCVSASLPPHQVAGGSADHHVHDAGRLHSSHAAGHVCPSCRWRWQDEP